LQYLFFGYLQKKFFYGDYAKWPKKAPKVCLTQLIIIQIEKNFRFFLSVLDWIDLAKKPSHATVPLKSLKILSQVSEKADYNLQRRAVDDEQQRRHFQSWETFWGRPGTSELYFLPHQRPNAQRIKIRSLGVDNCVGVTEKSVQNNLIVDLLRPATKSEVQRRPVL
jgi:hypothetical protein